MRTDREHQKANENKECLVDQSDVPFHRCKCILFWVKASSWNWCWLLPCMSPGPQRWVQPLQP